jgi:hypothetical protein
MDADKGDVPLCDLRWRCSNCGSSEFTDFVATAKDVRPR